MCRVTYDGGEPPSAARSFEEDRESEGSQGQDDGQDEDVGDCLGDVVLTAGCAVQQPAEVSARLLGQTARPHRHHVLVRHAVLRQITRPVRPAQKVNSRGKVRLYYSAL